MNAHALISEQRETVQPFDPAQLAAANINPATGLATDYLNHFNEAIMLLDLVPAHAGLHRGPDEWRVMSYREHFLSTPARSTATWCWPPMSRPIREPSARSTS